MYIYKSLYDVCSPGDVSRARTCHMAACQIVATIAIVIVMVIIIILLLLLLQIMIMIIIIIMIIIVLGHAN